jgi:hypothetical protein
VARIYILEDEMVKPNTSFNLTVNDVYLIEEALNHYIGRLQERRKTHVESTIIPESQLEPVRQIDNEIRKVISLLGSLHNQKNWYRPNGIYISG